MLFESRHFFTLRHPVCTNISTKPSTVHSSFDEHGEAALPTLIVVVFFTPDRPSSMPLCPPSYAFPSKKTTHDGRFINEKQGREGFESGGVKEAQRGAPRPPPPTILVVCQLHRLFILHAAASSSIFLPFPPMKFNDKQMDEDDIHGRYKHGQYGRDEDETKHNDSTLRLRASLPSTHPPSS